MAINLCLHAPNIARFVFCRPANLFKDMLTSFPLSQIDI